MHIILTWKLHASQDYSACIRSYLQCILQVDKFEPAQLADVLSAYANMVHHPGALIEPLTEKLLPKLDSMDAGKLQYMQ